MNPACSPPPRDDWATTGLHALRFAFAMAVLVGHLSQPLFHTNWPDMTRHAMMAVGGFFVLSGYTIRAVTERSRSFEAGSFLIDRASRLLSVSLFALVLTVAADAASARLAPAYYQAHFGSALSEPLIRVVANALLVSQLYGQDISPFSNSPFWSLSYEAGFYVIWAAMMHWRRSAGSVLWLVAAVVFYGPNVAFMMPFWLLGTLLFDLGRWQGWPRTLLSLSVVTLVAVFMAVRGTVAGGEALLAIDQALQWFIDAVFSALGIDAGRVRGSIILAAVKVFLVLIPTLQLADWLSARWAVPAALAKASKWLGDLTFPLYLVHFPLLVLAAAGQWFNPRSNTELALLVLVMLTLAAVTATVANSLKDWMRGAMRQAVLRSRSAEPSIRG